MEKEKEVKRAKIKAAVFDLDGVIISSKTAEYESWRRIFKACNVNLTIQEWISIIDKPTGVFDPTSVLIERCCYGKRLVPSQIETLRTNLYEDLRKQLSPLPRAFTLIKECRQLGLLLGIASNGNHEKVDFHLSRLKLAKFFQVVKCRDDVKNKKPAPDLYLAVLDDFGFKPNEVVVFEDSPPGITAAKAAGIYCIGCPNRITKHLDLSEADEICRSLKEFSMKQFLGESR